MKESQFDSLFMKGFDGDDYGGHNTRTVSSTSPIVKRLNSRQLSYNNYTQKPLQADYTRNSQGNSALSAGVETLGRLTQTRRDYLDDSSYTTDKPYTNISTGVRRPQSLPDTMQYRRTRPRWSPPAVLPEIGQYTSNQFSAYEMESRNNTQNLSNNDRNHATLLDAPDTEQKVSAPSITQTAEKKTAYSMQPTTNGTNDTVSPIYVAAQMFADGYVPDSGKLNAMGLSDDDARLISRDVYTHNYTVEQVYEILLSMIGDSAANEALSPQNTGISRTDTQTRNQPTETRETPTRPAFEDLRTVQQEQKKPTTEETLARRAAESFAGGIYPSEGDLGDLGLSRKGAEFIMYKVFNDGVSEDAVYNLLRAINIRKNQPYETSSPSLSSAEQPKVTSLVAQNNDTIRTEAQQSHYVIDTPETDRWRGYTSTYRGGEYFDTWSGTYIDTGFDDVIYDYINRNKMAIERVTVNDVRRDAILFDTDHLYLQKLTDSEISQFNYYYSTSGKAKAYEYIDSLRSELKARLQADIEETARDYAREHPVTASIYTIATAPVQLISALSMAMDYISDGEVDRNASYNLFKYTSEAIRDEVSGIVENNWGPVGSIAYSVGMQLGDFVVTSVLFGHNQILTKVIMTSSATIDTVLEAKERGVSDSGAIALGAITGIFEYFSDKIPMEKLFAKTPIPKEIYKRRLIESMADAGASVTADIVNFIVDILISKEHSKWQTAIDERMCKGMSEKEAILDAFAEQACHEGMCFVVDFTTNYVGDWMHDKLNAEFDLDNINEKRIAQGKTPFPKQNLSTDMDEYNKYWQMSRGEEIVSLDKYLEMKYDNPDRWRKFTAYATDKYNGDLSPYTSFKQYETVAQGIPERLYGIVTANNVTVKSSSSVFFHNAVNFKAESFNNYTAEDIRDALIHGAFRSTGSGRNLTYEYSTNKCTVKVNPANGRLLGLEFKFTSRRRMVE